MNKIFIGYDHRQPVSFSALMHSIIHTASAPVEIIALKVDQLPVKRTGLTPFTYSRFLVPYLCGYQGMALFMDVDMLVCDDINKLFEMADPDKTVTVVKNQKRFEWASLMLFNNPRCGHLSLETVETSNKLHTLSWLDDDQIGEFPAKWNHLVGYDDPIDNPSIIHYTQGVPAYPETKDCEQAGRWLEVATYSASSAPWKTLMARSVHAVQLPDGTFTPRLTFGEERLSKMITARDN